MSIEPTKSSTPQQELDQLTALPSPIYLIRKALSSVGIVLLIGSGVLLNWIIALIFAVSALGSVVWWQYLGALLLLLAGFPALYLFFAWSYGQSVVVWEAYREILRPFLAKGFGKMLDLYLVDDPKNAPPVEESRIVAEVEQRKKHFLERLPDFLRAYVQLFFTAGDVLTIVRAQRQSGQEKQQVKEKSMKSFFESLDLQVSELAEPSYIPALILAAVNLGLIYWLL